MTKFDLIMRVAVDAADLDEAVNLAEQTSFDAHVELMGIEDQTRTNTAVGPSIMTPTLKTSDAEFLANEIYHVLHIPRHAAHGDLVRLLERRASGQVEPVTRDLTAIKTAAIAEVEEQFDAMTGKQRTALWHAIGNAVDVSASPQPHEPGGVAVTDQMVERLRVQLMRHREVEIDAAGLRAALADALALSGPRS